jgi:hypothetical protein
VNHSEKTQTSQDTERKFSIVVQAVDASLSQLGSQQARVQARLEALERQLAAMEHNPQRKPDPPPAQQGHRNTALKAAAVAEVKPVDQAVSTHADPSGFALSVFELADAGSSPVEIAHVLNSQVGKVELVLALRKM